MVYVVGSTSPILFVTAVLGAERGRPGATGNDFSDAIWWAITARDLSVRNRHALPG